MFHSDHVSTFLLAGTIVAARNINAIYIVCILHTLIYETLTVQDITSINV